MRNKYALLLPAAALICCGSAQAALYNVDWTKNSTPGTLYSGGAAVGSAGDIWNTTDSEANVFTDLQNTPDSSGAASTVSVVWSDELQSTYNDTDIDFGTSGPGGTNLNPLMQDLAFTHPGTTATITISGLALNSDYTFYLLGHPNGSSQDVTFGVTGAAESAQTLSGNVKNDDNGFAAGVDYAVFTGNTGGTGTIVYTQTGSSFSGSAGFQLDVVPEPSVALLGGLGLLGLLRRRR